MKCKERDVDRLYQDNLTTARQLLASLSVAGGREPNIQGLNGWVYEQTIHCCLSEELMKLGLSPTMIEQVSLHRKARIDLLVDRVAIEIKAGGSFGNDAVKYRGYRFKVEEKGWEYFYLTRTETYEPYRLATVRTFGKECSFFMDTEGDWERFVREVAENINKSSIERLQPMA
jgi:hypothetical protein